MSVAKNRVCQVPYCNADLYKLSRFNIRCKICDEHRLADEVEIDGQSQRFCQQCNRFHPLSEFDKNRRGCRDKLAKHNLRRHQKTAMATKVHDVMIPAEDVQSIFDGVLTELEHEKPKHYASNSRRKGLTFERDWAMDLQGHSGGSSWEAFEVLSGAELHDGFISRRYVLHLAHTLPRSNHF